MMIVTDNMVKAAQHAFDTAPTIGWLFDKPAMYFAIEAALNNGSVQKEISEEEKKELASKARMVFDNTSDYAWILTGGKMQVALEKVLASL